MPPFCNLLVQWPSYNICSFAAMHECWDSLTAACTDEELLHSNLGFELSKSIRWESNFPPYWGAMPVVNPLFWYGLTWQICVGFYSWCCEKPFCNYTYGLQLETQQLEHWMCVLKKSHRLFVWLHYGAP